MRTSSTGWVYSRTSRRIASPSCGRPQRSPMPSTFAPDATAAAVLDWLGAQRDEMAALLERLARAESPSLDPGSHEAALGIIVEELERLDFSVRRIRRSGSSSEHLFA